MSLTIKKEHYSFEVVQLSEDKVQLLSKLFRSTKQKNLLLAINGCPGLLTHYLSKTFFYNNIPDVIASINKKLHSEEVAIFCVEPALGSVDKSHSWFLCKSKPVVF